MNKRGDFRNTLIINSILFGTIGPVLILFEIPGIGVYDPDKVFLSSFLAHFHIYLWPWKLMSWGGEIWQIISIMCNYLMYFFCCFVGLSTIHNKKSRMIFIFTIALWSLFIALFLAGFELTKIHYAPFIAGFLYYIILVFLNDLIIRIKRVRVN